MTRDPAFPCESAPGRRAAYQPGPQRPLLSPNDTDLEGHAMSPDLLLFGVGGLLLVTGLLGGGFELRELKIPQVGRVARVCATGAGGACILLGFGLSTALTDPAPDPDPKPEPVASVSGSSPRARRRARTPCTW